MIVSYDVEISDFIFYFFCEDEFIFYCIIIKLGTEYVSFFIFIDYITYSSSSSGCCCIINTCAGG